MRILVCCTTMSFAHMIHRGEIIEKVVRDSAYPISKIAQKLGKSRRHIYNIFENNKVSWDTIREIGIIIGHDFSKEFKELNESDFVTARENATVYYTSDKLELIRCKQELETTKQKYIDLLERYNELLSDKMKTKK